MNALYTSKTVQNEILEITAEMIREKIHKRVLDSPCWAFMADETTDRANREQLVYMVARYVHNHEGSFVVREDHVQILDLITDVHAALMTSSDSDTATTSGGSSEARMSGENIASVIVQKLRQMPLDPNTFIGCAVLRWCCRDVK